MATINGVKSKVFSKPKLSKDDIIVINPTDTHLIKDTKKRTAQRQEEHKATDWEDVAIIVAISAFLAYVIIRSLFTV